MAALSYKTVRRRPILTGMAIRASRRMLARSAPRRQAAILRATVVDPLMAADRVMVMAMDMPDIVAIIMNGMKAGKVCGQETFSLVA